MAKMVCIKCGLGAAYSRKLCRKCYDYLWKRNQLSDAEYPRVMPKKTPTPKGEVQTLETRRKYKETHRLNHPEYYGNQKKYRVTKRNEDRHQVVLIKEGAPCMDCLQWFPSYCMHFDHRDDADKCFEISNKVGKLPLVTVLAEIAKCDLVCANCHSTRTYFRMHNQKMPGPQSESSFEIL